MITGTIGAVRMGVVHRYNNLKKEKKKTVIKKIPIQYQRLFRVKLFFYRGNTFQTQNVI